MSFSFETFFPAAVSCIHQRPKSSLLYQIVLTFCAGSVLYVLNYLFRKKTKWVESLGIVGIHQFFVIGFVFYGVQVRVSTNSGVVVESVFEGLLQIGNRL